MAAVWSRYEIARWWEIAGMLPAIGSKDALYPSNDSLTIRVSALFSVR